MPVNEVVDDDVEYMGVVTNNSSVGDVIIRALDTLICPSVLPITFANNEPLYTTKVKRYRTYCPKNWRLIAEYYKENRNVVGTIRHFNLGEAGVVRNNAYWVTTIGRWVIDNDNVNKTLAYCRVACYGEKIDLALKNIVIRYNEHAVPMTPLILRLQLLTILQAENRNDILDCIAGPKEPISKIKPYRFDKGWAQRFYKRHDLVHRVATTKMREEIPEKYEEKVLTCKLILSLNIVKHNVPDALIVNFDVGTQTTFRKKAEFSPISSLF